MRKTARTTRATLDNKGPYQSSDAKRLVHRGPAALRAACRIRAADGVFMSEAAE